MDAAYEADQKSPLFAGISETEWKPVLACLAGHRKEYAKGSVIYTEGDEVNEIGLLLSGQIIAVYEDLLGGRSILGTFEAGQLVGDAYSCASEHRMLAGLTAKTNCSILFLDTERVLHVCPENCAGHRKLTENLIHILADKYVALSRKVIHLSGRTTRRKLLSYLSEQRQEAGGNPFPVPFNRQELADYLFTERSGLSTEWNLLLREGLLTEKDGLYSLKITPCAGSDCGEKKK